MEKHRSTEVSIPKYLAKFWKTETFAIVFGKFGRNFCGNVKVRKTWVTHEKKLKKYFRKSSKKLGRNFEEIRHNFLNI